MLDQKYFSLPLWVWLALVIVILISCYNSPNTMKKIINVSQETVDKKEIKEKTEKFSEVSKPKIKMFNFNTEWCGWSKKFQPEWNKFSELVQQNPKLSHIGVYDIKCDNPTNESMCEKYQVPGYPYVVVEVNDKPMPYNGQRSAESLLSFVESL